MVFVNVRDGFRGVQGGENGTDACLVAAYSFAAVLVKCQVKILDSAGRL